MIEIVFKFRQRQNVHVDRVLLTSKNSAKLKQYFAEFLEEIMVVFTPCRERNAME